MEQKELSLEERKIEFEKCVITWLAIKDCHGSWDDVAEFFGTTREEVIATCISSLNRRAKLLGLEVSESSSDSDLPLL